MNRVALLFLASLALGPLGARADDDIPKIADLNGDNVWSLNEMRGTYPDMTEDLFAAIDRNGDGGINATELAVAMAQQQLPFPAE